MRYGGWAEEVLNRREQRKQRLCYLRSLLFKTSWSITRSIEIIAAKPEQAGGLQAIDYFLWALQRLYERGEDRYWEYVAAQVSLVHDVDDTRENDYGACYTKKNPLRLEECKKIEPGI